MGRGLQTEEGIATAGAVIGEMNFAGVFMEVQLVMTVYFFSQDIFLILVEISLKDLTELSATVTTVTKI